MESAIFLVRSKAIIEHFYIIKNYFLVCLVKISLNFNTISDFFHYFPNDEAMKIDNYFILKRTKFNSNN